MILTTAFKKAGEPRGWANLRVPFGDILIVEVEEERKFCTTTLKGMKLLTAGPPEHASPSSTEGALLGRQASF
jgi:hypothetical protein